MLDYASSLAFVIENRGGNPRLKTFFGIVHALNMDTNDIFYPEMKHEIPVQVKLRTTFSDCSDSGAEMLYEAYCAVLFSVRKKKCATIE